MKCGLSWTHVCEIQSDPSRSKRGSSSGLEFCSGDDLIGRVLIDLEQSDEPAWAYLEYQHEYIVGRLRSVHDAALDKVKGELRASA